METFVKKEKKIAQSCLFIIGGMSILILLLLAKFSFVQIVAIFFVLYFCKRIISEVTNKFPILEIILFINGVQIIAGPIWVYTFLMDDSEIFGYINLYKYLLIALPGYILFSIGCLFHSKINLDKNEIQKVVNKKRNIFYLKIFYFAGLSGMILVLLKSSPFDNIFNILGGIAVSISICFLYSKSIKYKYVYMLIIYSVIALEGVMHGIFAQLIAYSFLLLIFLPNLYSWSKKKILLFLFCGVLGIYTLNTIKYSYRELMWSENKRDFDVMTYLNLLFTTPLQNKEGRKNDDKFIKRFSLGLVNSQIYKNVPEFQPHTKGKEFINDFKKNIMPRFLFPDKQPIDTRKNYMLYTGLYLPEDTSVGINPFGIAYAEFGIFGSFIFLFLYGLLLSFIFNQYVKRYKKTNNIMYLIFLPFIFMPFYNAETEFVGVIDSSIKTIFFMFLVLNIFKLLKVR